MRVHWSNHAIERVTELFGFRDDILIPNDTIARHGAILKPGYDFRVVSGGVTFVCLRLKDFVLILTVTYSGKRSVRKKFRKKRSRK